MCVCVRLLVKSNLTSEALVCRENAAMYSASNKGQFICGIFSETAPLLRSSTPSLGWPYIQSAIFPVDNTHVQCAFSKVRDAQCDARAPCCKLSLCSI